MTNTMQLQCPFCASFAGRVYSQTVKDSNPPHTEYYYGCNNCGASGPNELTQEKAKEMWNMRRETFPGKAQVIDLETEIRERQAPTRGACG